MRNRIPQLAAGVLLLVLPQAALSAQDEGLVIRQLKFKGNKSFDETVLAASIATTRSSFFATWWPVRWLGLGEKRRFNEREFRRDVPRLRVLYQVSGFLDAEVDTVVRRTERDAYITFRITEGEPVRVRRISITGIDSLPDHARLVQDLPLRVGMPYNRNLLVALADTLQERLRERGYPTPVVSLTRPTVDQERRSPEVEVVVDPGTPAVIGSVRVEGTLRVDSAFVRSLLATEPGRRYRKSDLYTSQLNLFRSELFRIASVAVDTIGFTIGDPAVPLLVQVEEGGLHRVRAATGYGTNDCFRTSVGWTARNFLGFGQIFDASAQLSKIGVGDPLGWTPVRSSICGGLERDSVGSAKANYILSTSFRRPGFVSPSNALTLALFAERRSEFLVYLRNDIGGSVTLTRETARRIPISLAYRLSYGRTEANAVSFCAFFNACQQEDIKRLREQRLIATLTGTVSRQRVNNLLDPSRGSTRSLEATLSSRVLGSSELTQFTRLVGDAAWYRPLGSDAVLAWHLRAGIIFAPRIRLDVSAANFIPPEQRFYAGGANDVRGYNRNELGPVVYVVADSVVKVNPDSTVTVPEGQVHPAPTGGNTLVQGNLELRLPSPVLRQRLRWAVFVDAGSVWERGGTLSSTSSIRFTPGFGLRFATPLGPTRFDLAYNPYRLPAGSLYAVEASGDLRLVSQSYQRPSGKRGGLTFQFSVGQAF